ncbi:MAG: DUF1611 domain-containing protein [Candidatus Poribacteria bacterium]|nr:DUF1611 domain-containing protein [Candidatus Poribacteria bacterium]
MERRLQPNKHKMVILAEGSFGILESKTATVLVRYLPDNVVAVIDSTKAGKDVSEVIEVGRGIPVVSSLAEAMELHPTMLAIGIAPPGGELPEAWRSILQEAIEHGLHVMSGLHRFLSDDPQLADLAKRHNVILWDVRKPPANLPVATCKAADVDSTVVLTVGSDCRVGKMVASIEIADRARNRGLDAEFCATGQNGMMISGWGIAIDAVVSDFTAGASERIVLDGAKNHDLLIVEGQGSLVHPGYSGVTLGLLHGSMPDAMIFCHQPSRKIVARYTVPLPSLTEMIRQYEMLAKPIKPAKVIGLALNCFDLTEDEAREAIEAAERETGLPATDVIRFGADKLVDVIERMDNDKHGRPE